MSRVEEITAILSEIACQLRSQQQELTTNLIHSISSLNQTLNLNNNEGESRVRVLETTLSLMCFKTPQVFNLMVEDLVQTIVTVLKSSIMHKVLRFQKEEFLQVGSSISRFDCEELIKACLDIIGRLEEHHGTLSHMLFRVVLRVTASASSYKILSPFPYIRSIQQCLQKKDFFLQTIFSSAGRDLCQRRRYTSKAYFPHKQPLLLMLAGPVSCKTFQELVHFIRELILQGDDHSDLVSKRSSINARMMDHKSTWARFMNFPIWFYFSASLLFTGRNCTLGAVKAQLHDLEKIRDAASRYLTWILIPTNEYLSDLLLNFFTEKSRSFEKHGLDTRNVNGSVRRKLGKPKVRENKDTMASKEYDGHAMRHWLNEFHDCHDTFCKRAVNDRELIGEKTQKVLDPRHSLLFRRIPLGIFIWVSDLNEEACQCLFHYAASGSILPHDKRKSAMSSRKSDEKEEAIEGARLVFDLFDVIEEMSESIFGKESEGDELVCRLKVKAGGFWLCVWKSYQVFKLMRLTGRC